MFHFVLTFVRVMKIFQIQLSIAGEYTTFY